jgi:hypothetical protein
LTLGLAQQFRGLSEIDGTTIHGSDGVSAALFLGVDRVITPRVLVDFSLGVGLTRDSPDYVFQISTPVRF